MRDSSDSPDSLKSEAKALDCRAVVERELGAPLKRYGDSWRWGCPFHHGQDDNFAVTAQGYKCHSQCGDSGDAIKFIMQWRNLSFVDALYYLTGKAPGQPIPYRVPAPPPKPAALPVSGAALADIAVRAQAKLWDGSDSRGLEYLYRRGFQDATIQAAGLGYIPNHKPFYKVHGLTVFAGIVIPSSYCGQIEFLQFRNIWSSDHKLRYRSLGKAQGTLFGGDRLRPFEPILLFEGAFDSLIAAQLGFNAAALSSASNTLAPRWYPTLMTAPYVMLCGDGNEAGRDFMARHQELGPAFIAWKPPAHDLNELYLADEFEAHAVCLGADIEDCSQEQPIAQTSFLSPQVAYT